MDIVGTSVDGVGVLIVVGGAIVATLRLARRLRDPAHRAGSYYVTYRQDVGRAILLGLEFLIAGDLIRTVVVAPTMHPAAESRRLSSMGCPEFAAGVSSEHGWSIQ